MTRDDSLADARLESRKFGGSLCEQFLDWFSKAVARDVEGTFLHIVGQLRRDAHRGVKRGMQVLNHHAILERLARAFVRRDAVEMSPLHSAAKEQHAASVGEVAV